MFKRLFSVLLLAVVVAAALPALAQDKPRTDEPAPKSKMDGFVVSGKLFYPLTRTLILPYTGTINQVTVQIGQPVKKGQALVRYTLAAAEWQRLNRQTSPFRLNDLNIRLAEMDRTLLHLRQKRLEQDKLAQSGLAPKEGVTELDREIKLLERERALLWQVINYESSLGHKELTDLQEHLGAEVKPGQVPEEAVLVPTLDGRVVWIGEWVQPGAELPAGTKVVTVGVMDPMVVRANVYEIEMVGLKLGDQAELTLEAIPGRKFTAAISHISWTPVTPALREPSYYRVDFTVPNPDLLLKEGFKCLLTIGRPEKVK